MRNPLASSLSVILLAGGTMTLAFCFARAAGAGPQAGEGAADREAAGDLQAVKKANQEFYAALNAMLEGDPQPVEKVFWHTDDVVFMGADGGYQVGWKDTYASWEKMAALKLGGKVEPAEVKLAVGANLAVAHSYVTGFHVVRGVREEIKVRATSVFRKEGDVWKMMSHHVDLRPSVRDQLKKKSE
jgi:ketosteroid isomerase-like protein